MLRKQRLLSLANASNTYTPGFPVPNRKKTSKDKSKVYERSILSTRSSPTSAAVSTFNGAGYRGYYNSQVLDWSQRLYAPTAIECADLHSSSLSTFSSSMTRDFWFTTKMKTTPQTVIPSCPTISLPSTPSSSVECKDEELPRTEENDEELKEAPSLITNRVRMYFNSSQRAMLRQWIGCCRQAYNMVTADFRQLRTLRSQAAYRGMLKDKILGEWSYMKGVPYNALDEVLKQAVSNIKSARTNLQRGNIPHYKAPFRCKKKDTQMLPVRAQNITRDLKIYPRSLFSKNLYSEADKYIQKHREHTNYDPARLVRDSQLIYKRRAKRWYLCLVSQRNGLTDREKQASVSQTYSANPSVVAIDPGNRTFATWYSPSHGIGKVGDGDGQKLIKLCLHLDTLYGKRARANHKKKCNLNRAIAKLRSRLENLREDFHRKVSSWLTKTFDVIVLPVFNTHLMAKRGERNIGTKTVRGLMTWAHGKFRQTLKTMCAQTGTTLIHPSEAYTSKTCSTCGWIDERLGGSEVFRCLQEHKNVDRDVNGARGIFLRALLGGALSL